MLCSLVLLATELKYYSAQYTYHLPQNYKHFQNILHLPYLDISELSNVLVEYHYTIIAQRSLKFSDSRITNNRCF